MCSTGSQSLLADSLLKHLAMSLYIHYPFCMHKCPYCDFASTAEGTDQTRDHLYITAMIAEFRRKLPLLGHNKLVSVYFGGGTPSLCPPSELARLMEVIKPYLIPDAEVSIEINPGTVDEATLKAFREIGFNRVSLGVQSFHDMALKRLGRIHDSKAAYDVYSWARKYFDNINIDLMHGLPKQELKDALDDVKIAVSLQPEHISWYELTIEEGTPFYRKPPVLPSEETLGNIEDQGQVILLDNGYINYEISAYSRGPQYRCVHNVNYWAYGDYIGLGAGAHQKYSRMKDEELLWLDKYWRFHPDEQLKAAKKVMSYLFESVGVHMLLKPARMLTILEIYRQANPEEFQDYIQGQLDFALTDGTKEADHFISEALRFGCKVDATKVKVRPDDAEEPDTKCLDFLTTDQLPPNFANMAGSLVSQKERPFEYMLNHLRLINVPFTCKDFFLRTGLLPNVMQKDIRASHEKGLLSTCIYFGCLGDFLENSEKPIYVTAKGYRMLNELISNFLPKENEPPFGV